jgi:hypothetical protein
MANDGRTAEKLRGFLRELSPRVRAMLLAELERGEQRGAPMPGADIIIRELRAVEQPADAAPAAPAAPAADVAASPAVAPAESSGPRPDLEGEPARLFFALFEPFFVDDAAENAHQGRLARSSAEPIWEWICRDLVPDEAQAYAENVTKLVAANEQARAAQAANAFHERVAQAIDKSLSGLNGDDKSRRKLAHQIGSPRALEDARYFATILKSRAVLAVLAGKVPPKVRNLTDEQIGSIVNFVDSTAGKNREFYVTALALVLGRLAAPWQLIRVAIKAADSDFPARILETPYAPAVAMVLAELERLVRALDADLRRGEAMKQPTLLKDIHDAARGLRTEIDLSADSGWSRSLAAIRSQLAVALRPEIESAPGRVRRMLRLRPTKDIAAGSALDPSDIEETEALLGFVGQCRSYANELAINEMTMRSFTEVQNYLESQVQQLLEGLRTAGKTDRGYRQSQFDAAVRFCGKIFGPEYAQTLTKAAAVAQAKERQAAAAAKAS